MEVHHWLDWVTLSYTVFLYKQVMGEHRLSVAVQAGGLGQDIWGTPEAERGWIWPFWPSWLRRMALGGQQESAREREPRAAQQRAPCNEAANYRFTSSITLCGTYVYIVAMSIK